MKKARFRQTRPLLIVPFKTKTSNDIIVSKKLLLFYSHTLILSYFLLLPVSNQINRFLLRIGNIKD